MLGGIGAITGPGPLVPPEPEPPPPGGRGEPARGSRDFSGELGKALDRVEADQRAAAAMARRLAAGELTDLSQAMVASEQAYLSLATLIQVRNKLLEAYQEFMRMQV